MCIRKINYEQDIKRIKDIWRKHSNSNEKWQNVDNEIKCARNETYVIIDNDSIVGFITIRAEEIEVTDKYRNRIFELFTYPTGMCFGSKIIEEMQDKRCFLSLHVKKTNLGAINFYKSKGFKIKGENLSRTKHYMEWPDTNDLAR